MNRERRARALDAVERSTAVPMLALTVVFVAILLVPLIVTLPPVVAEVLPAVEWVIWACFAAELAVKTYLAPDRRRYLISHWFDVVIVLLPLLRPLRVVRSVRLLRLLRAVRLLALAVDFAMTLRTVLGRHGLHYALLVAVALFVGSAAAVTFLERNAGGDITTFGDALWWAAATVTTVGYGDLVPDSPEGRGVGVFLMFVGIALYSFLTANVAAFLVQSEREPVAAESPATLDDVMAQLRRLEDQLARLQASQDQRDSAPVTPGKE